jgi:outer membrane protein assembly factor BamB
LGFFGAGSGVLYAFEMLKPESIATGPQKVPYVWKFLGHPLAQTQDHVPADHQHDSTSYEVTAMPVFHNNRLYVVFTQEPFHRMKLGRLACVDATKSGDVTRSALVWSYDKIGSSDSTVAVAEGLVYAAGFDGRLHCLDAESGKVYWVQELGGPISSSPLVADGKVYVGTHGRELWVFAAGRGEKVLATVRLDSEMSGTPTAANGCTFRLGTNQPMRNVALGRALIAADQTDMIVHALAAPRANATIWRRWEEAKAALVDVPDARLIDLYAEDLLTIHDADRAATLAPRYVSRIPRRTKMRIPTDDA